MKKPMKATSPRPTSIAWTSNLVLINTAASARWKHALALAKLFQQFTRLFVKPSNRLACARPQLHRAKATVQRKVDARICAMIGIAALVIVAAAGSSFAQPTALTYQGRLNLSGSPATGTYDLTFALYDSLSGGAQK